MKSDIDWKQIAVILIAVILFLAALTRFGWVILFISSIIALLLLKILSWLGVKIRIDMITILIVVLAGIPGLLILMLLALTGIAFNENKKS
jgi:hypothetical protein